MDSMQLKRVMNLIERTGDKLIIMDKTAGEPTVIMPLEQYEEIVDLKEEKLVLDKRPGRELKFNEDLHSAANADSSPSEEQYPKRQARRYLHRENESEFKNDLPISRAVITAVAPEFLGEEVSLEDVPHEEEEEKFYLEPIE